jgi:hypothetical protein
MAGGGIIIIRNGIKQVLSDPLVHGQLPQGIQSDIANALATDTSAWLPEDDKATKHAFTWAMKNVK